MDNIQTFNLGFSDTNQIANFYVDFETSVNASARNLVDNPHLAEIKAEVRTLDDFFPSTGANKLDFIKCDVEGAELLVFKGGIQVINQFQPIIFTEMLRKWSAKFNYHPNEIILLLDDIGYRCFTAKNGELINFYQMDDNTLETNFFFLHIVKHASQIKRLCT